MQIEGLRNCAISLTENAYVGKKIFVPSFVRFISTCTAEENTLISIGKISKRDNCISFAICLYQIMPDRPRT